MNSATPTAVQSPLLDIQVSTLPATAGKPATIAMAYTSECIHLQAQFSAAQAREIGEYLRAAAISPNKPRSQCKPCEYGFYRYFKIDSSRISGSVSCFAHREEQAPVNLYVASQPPFQRGFGVGRMLTRDQAMALGDALISAATAIEPPTNETVVECRSEPITSDWPLEIAAIAERHHQPPPMADVSQASNTNGGW